MNENELEISEMHRARTPNAQILKQSASSYYKGQENRSRDQSRQSDYQEKVERRPLRKTEINNFT